MWVRILRVYLFPSRVGVWGSISRHIMRFLFVGWWLGWRGRAGCPASLYYTIPVALVMLSTGLPGSATFPGILVAFRYRETTFIRIRLYSICRNTTLSPVAFSMRSYSSTKSSTYTVRWARFIESLYQRKQGNISLSPVLVYFRVAKISPPLFPSSPQTLYVAFPPEKRRTNAVVKVFHINSFLVTRSMSHIYSQMIS